jgi:DNA-binding MarR family transcriptional regulator
VTVKQLLASIPYSDTGIRKHFEHLLATELIQLEGDPVDRRLRYVKATNKLNKLFAEWAASGIILINNAKF